MQEPRSFWTDAPNEPWRIVAERKIEEWIEAGGLRDLPGKGTPLVLEDNPFLDPELRLPFKILQNAGIAPAWIEIGQEVEDTRERWRRYAEQQRRRHATAKARLSRMFGQTQELAARRLAIANEGAVAEYTAGLRELNRLIDRFNMNVPIFTLQRRRVDVEAEGRKLARALGVDYDAVVKTR